MNNRWLCLLAVINLAAVGLAVAQEPEPIFDEKACPPASGCNGVCTFDWTPYYEKGVRLLDLQEGTDFKTMRLEDFPQGPTDPKINQARETWYVRKEALSGQTGPLYRCRNGAIPDHRDSASSSEGAPSYTCLNSLGQLDSLGNPWSDPAKANRTPAGAVSSALLPLRRYLKTGGSDHKTWLSTTPSGYQLNTTFSGANARLGYERFGKLLQKSQVIGSGESSGYGVNFLDNAVLRVDFNRTWGNAIGRITQVATGRQIVSEPIGDMVQSVVRFANGDPDCRTPNPTQSGGAQCVAPNYSITTRWAGSPTVSSARVGTDPLAPQTFTAVVRPFDFCHNGTNVLLTGGSTPPWPGTTPTDPLIWNGFTERTDTLTCKLGSTMRKDVMRTVSRYQLNGNHSGSDTTIIALNTYWLKGTDLVTGAQTTTEWDFKVYCKDLETGVVRQLLGSPSGKTLINSEGDTSCGAPPGTPITDTTSPRHRHAIIASRNDGTFAYAMARFNLPPGTYSKVGFRCAAGALCTDPTKGTLIVQAHTGALQLSKTQWTAPQESFLIVNSKGVIMDNAVNRLNELNNEALAGGVDCFN